MASGAGSAVVEAVDLTRKVTLYKRVASAAARAAAIDEANALIGAIVSVEGAPAGARCNFLLENTADSVSLAVTGDDFYIQQAVRLSRAGRWSRTLSIAEEIRVRTIPARTEMAAEGERVGPNARRLHNLNRVTRRSAGFSPMGGISQMAAYNPQLRLANVARISSEQRQVARLAGRRALQRQVNAGMAGRQLAEEQRQTRRNVRAALGRARLSSSSSSNN
jgi:hypothetical protein